MATRTPTQSDWNRFARGVRRRARKLIERYAAEEISAEEFGERFHDLLADRHGRAGYLGRRRGGADWDFDDDDREFGELIADEEQEFLDQFIADLAQGRYRTAKGEPDIEAMDRRAQMYVRKVRGTSNEAFVGTADTEDEIEWLMSASEHCQSCRDLAAGSPYKPDELTTYPGSGGTICLTNCRCRLKRVSDKREGFRSE